MVKKYITVGLFSLALAFSLGIAAPIQAASLSSVQVQAIVSLLKSFGVDATTIGNITASLGGSAPAHTTCVTINGNLTLGSSGAEVTQLQGYLTQSGLLDAQYNTGYYGILTVKAVGKLQMNLGILSSPNDPSYGIMGPRTRAAVACSGSNTVTTSTASSVAIPSAIIDPSSFSASTGGKDAAVVTLNGTASNVSLLQISLDDADGGPSVQRVSVSGGHWSATFPSVFPGSHSITVLDSDSGPFYTHVLTTGTLTVNGVTPTVTIDQSSLSASTGGKNAIPVTLSGSGSNVSALQISLDGADGGPSVQHATVSGGRWSATFPSVFPGSHSVTVQDVDVGTYFTHILTTGTLVVLQTTNGN